MKFNKNLIALSIALLTLGSAMQARQKNDYDQDRTTMNKENTKKEKKKNSGGGTPRRQRVYARRHPNSRNQE